ncbi:MAG TPA: methyltransferase domain-containing protein [Rickettsiales bacterium]|nr:methyltransferase domain-containing protein [Rickettsiales bacterium]
MAILEEIETGLGRISILDSQEKGTRTYYHNNCSHSEVNGDGISTCAYIHLMYHIILDSGAKKVLMLGCGGGTLATMLHKAGCKVTVVDISSESFTVAKRYFALPQEVECIVQDAFSYVADTTQAYDAIAIDVFDSKGTIPEPFTTPVFFRHIRRILNFAGVIVMNVIIDHDFDMKADRIALNMELLTMPAMLLDWDNDTDRNMLIAAGAIDDLHISLNAYPEFIRKELKRITQRRIRSRVYQEKNKQ